ncbi:RNA-directed DNA polymerase [Rhizobium sp. CFBP 8752]|uniref:reverse transcriptase domain-containing protein n=1 Tax=Rhizobium sp. CFBP 8752 TaxID=2775301 RepID=UPI00177D6BAE|nr:reverse transcriptase domain-containing protein [Rhizobium sp. CFBP 8752]MBD8662697.1 RNA-directed DNA polymerase [Rhizobium sp. CFBP 8752]
MLNFRFSEEYIQLDLFHDFGLADRESVVSEYIERISSNRAKPIFDTQHLSHLVGYSEQFLFSVSASPVHFYREYKIAKKSGGLRTLNEPLPTLKAVQKVIVHDIFRDVEPHKAAKAFRKNHTLRGNAVIHRRRPFMLKVDIKDFFSNIDQHAIYTLFYETGYTEQVARLLTGLCTLNGCLPQGAPTSPMLSNLAMRSFDNAVFEHCVQNEIFYTRYADDMTFSAVDERVRNIIPFIRSELKKCRLQINEKKTSFSGTGARKYLTGVVVNERLNILKEDRKNLRQEMYYIRKFGINGHLRKTENHSSNYIDRLAGRLNFAFFITKEAHFQEDMRYLQELKKVL